MSDSTASPTDSGQDIDALYGNQMSEADCKAFLREQGSGVLSLAREGTAYGIPVSFGFDGEDTLYFLLAGFHEPSRKKEFARATERASFLTYEGGSREDWRSVIAAGSLDVVPKDDLKQAREHVEDNAWFPDLFSKADPRGDVEVWRLRVDSLSGLHGGA
jgi:nitroimidazol reductase NimA-like FMN-containing flavoprotein (pyridoxamine 5'-phosphate oxidase superfamily)